MVVSSHYETYLNRMHESLFDKTEFFINRVKADHYLDFGCADGSLLELLSTTTNANLTGYDRDYMMIQSAAEKNIFASDLFDIVKETSYVKKQCNYFLFSVS